MTKMMTKMKKELLGDIIISDILNTDINIHNNVNNANNDDDANMSSCGKIKYQKLRIPRHKTMDPGTEYQKNKLYRKFNICHAPMGFDTRVSDDDKKKILPGAFTDLILSYLHVMYDNVVIPGVWKLGLSGKIELKESKYELRPYINVKNTLITPLQTFDDVIKYALNSPNNVHVMYASVESSESASARHAVMLTLTKGLTTIMTKDGKRRREPGLRVYVTDPFMQYNKKNQAIAQEILDIHMHKHGLDRVNVMLKRSAVGKFQSMNSKAPRTALDRPGFCAAWVLMMIEATARHICLHGYTLKSMSAFDLPSPFSSNNANIWRQLVKDYLFSRLVDAYTVAKHQKNKSINVISILKQLIITKYLTEVNDSAVMRAIIDYIPKFLFSKKQKKMMKEMSPSS